ncbi:Crp/Fnr family transcriptional regulator [Elizabethkingia anophelis]|uniref:Crp/Fnr family transcriptional regulator n=1 Tax=Elizabethkingia TaxID=308865 RepID=UPI00293C2E0F|nr:Crp/Fnr family transcriptional regulator [Elizabethkingia anophelis]MDV3564378.1 Crp/Fnr family transcriptional regulator [Elizabethkingia anophelis]MDV3623145.1 Crp/Fnr family transcriptional regulator [Elizabethkingia anophelis]MDV3643805.1 Crp/Fnr family transcriptional regulator [Elizabethkingia anophelis]MDV3656013.1 Crp/Fnr family transcriptional regulator [Elizabethkingia anophelis]
MKNLKNINAFKYTPEIIEQLYQNSIKKIYKSGTIILRENAYSYSIPIVTKGLLKVIRKEDEDNEVVLYYIKKGETTVLPFLGSIYNLTSEVRVIVEEDAEIFFLPIQKAILLTKEYPQWVDYILRLFIIHYEYLLNVIDLAFKKTDERLFCLLQNKAEVIQSNTITITHEQLAKELFTSRVVVSRLLKQLEEKGLLLLSRNKIIITEQTDITGY